MSLWNRTQIDVAKRAAVKAKVMDFQNDLQVGIPNRAYDAAQPALDEAKRKADAVKNAMLAKQAKLRGQVRPNMTQEQARQVLQQGRVMQSLEDHDVRTCRACQAFIARSLCDAAHDQAAAAHEAAAVAHNAAAVAGTAGAEQEATDKSSEALAATGRTAANVPPDTYNDLADAAANAAASISHAGAARLHQKVAAMHRDLSLKAAQGQKTKRARHLQGYEPEPYHADADENVTCPDCGKQNDDDASYCDQCGFKLAGADGVEVE